MQAAGLVGPILIAWLSDRSGKRRGITQITLLLSALTTVWLVQHGSLSILFYANLLLYGAFVQARGALTQTMIGDFASPELTDAAFSIYYFVGFISGPIWTLIIGYVCTRTASRRSTSPQHFRQRALWHGSAKEDRIRRFLPQRRKDAK
jgi:MFS family permease